MPHLATTEFTIAGKNGNSNHTNKFDYDSIKKAARVLRALNHKLRQQILDVLDESGKITVTDLYSRLSLEQSVTSQHLAILRNADVVKTERDGKFIYYSLNMPRINELSALVVQIIN